MKLSPAELSERVRVSTDMWSAFTETMGGGTGTAMDACTFAACAASSTVLLKPLGKCVRILRRSMDTDVATIRAAVTRVSSPVDMVEAAGKSPDTASAIVWAFRGLSFAHALADELVADGSTTTTRAARTAYDRTLHEFHSKTMRTMYRRGMELLPNRDKLRARVDGYNTEALLRDWARAVEPVLARLAVLCATQGWSDGMAVADSPEGTEMHALETGSDED